MADVSARIRDAGRGRTVTDFAEIVATAVGELVTRVESLESAVADLRAELDAVKKPGKGGK